MLPQDDETLSDNNHASKCLDGVHEWKHGLQEAAVVEFFHGRSDNQ